MNPVNSAKRNMCPAHKRYYAVHFFISHTITLAYTGCSDCVPSEVLCDGKEDCTDDSDEEYCGKTNSWPRGYKTSSLLNSAERNMCPAHKFYYAEISFSYTSSLLHTLVAVIVFLVRYSVMEKRTARTIVTKNIVVRLNNWSTISCNNAIYRGSNISEANIKNLRPVK